VTIRSTFYMDDQVHADLRLMAVALNTSMSALMERYARAGMAADAEQLLEARVVNELAAAAEQIQPSPGGLESIRAAIARKLREQNETR